MGERDKWEVRGEGVPPGGEGGLSQPVPEHSHPLPISPEHMETMEHMKTKCLSVSDKSNMIHIPQFMLSPLQ